MYKGIVIKESLENIDILRNITITKEDTWKVENAAPGQAPTWSVVYIEVPEENMRELATVLSKAIRPGAWFVDVNNTSTRYVIFKDKIFSYPLSDLTSEKEAKTYARSIGVPESQLGW